MANNRKFSFFDTPPNLQGEQYAPRQTGFLGGLGQALSGFSAPFLPGGQENFLKQQALQQAQAEADYKNWISQQELGIKNKELLIKAYEANPESFGGNIADGTAGYVSGKGYGTYVKGIDSKGRKEYGIDTPKDIGERTQNIRKEFIDRPEVKEYQTISTQVGSMDKLLSEAKAGKLESLNFLDQGLITIFNKINDPTSVVRESEYARTPQGLAIANRLQGALDKLMKGGAGLTVEDREALVKSAKIIANERGKTFNDRWKEYRNIAIKQKVSAKEALAGLKPHSELEIGLPKYKNKQQESSSGFVRIEANGNIYNIPKNEIEDFKKEMGIK